MVAPALPVDDRATSTLAAVAVGVLRADAFGRIEYVNPMLEVLSGWPCAAARGHSVTAVLSISDGRGGTHFDAAACALGLGRSVQFPREALLAQRDGRQFAVDGVATPIFDQQQRPSGVVVTVRDVSEDRGPERDRTFLATHDQLTGLLNRRAFEARLQGAERAAANGLPWSLCCIDLDNFGVINDAHGHAVGDEVLKRVAGVLRPRLGDGSCVARVGGDEFAVLHAGCTAQDLPAVAEKLRAELAEIRVDWHEGPFQVHASVGALALGKDLPAPLRAAQSACRAAAERGGNRVELYFPDDTAVMRRSDHVAWLHRLNDAIENHRFDLVRQAIVPVAIAGAPLPMYEVLLRLPVRGGKDALPGAFLPAAERYRLCQSIDRWVVGRVLSSLAAGAAPPYRLTVNLAADSIASPAFLALLKADIAASGARTDRLLFEITETGVIADLRQAVRFIEEIRALGCGFLLDDFGRGMSGFAYLRELPVDFLKIDGKIVSRAWESPTRRAMLESIHHLGRVLHLQTIGECVEDEATMQMLLEIGVDYAQGNHLSMPEPFLRAPGVLANDGLANVG